MSEPRAEKKVEAPPLAVPVTNSSGEQDTEGFRSGSGDDESIDLRAFLAPAQGEGELGRLAQYRVLKELGRGGMGMVLLAEDSQLLRMAALKIMLPRYAKDPSARDRFLREARAAAKINHDNVVSIHQVGEENGLPFIAMEYLKGEPLDRYLKEKGELSIGQAIRIGREMAEGLQAAHAEGLIHRDIKPANVWLEAPKGRVKILDFGLARQERDDGNLTKSGAVIGTPAFMSPEQAHGKPLDPRSDLFSLGVVLYRLCTGQQPFTGPNTMAVLMSLGIDTPAPVRELNPNVPVELERLIHQLLEKDRNRRPASAEEAALKLAAIENPAAPGAPKALPEVIYVVPSATAVVNDPFADIDVTSAEISAKKPATRKPTSAVNERSQPKPEQRKQADGRSNRWLALALGAIVLLAGGFFAVKQMTKTDDNKVVERPKSDEPKLTPPAKPPGLLKSPFTKAQAEKARAEWAAYLQVPERKQLDLPKGVKLDLVLIPPGQFQMGTPGHIGNESPHQVTITRPFYMAVTETTQEQYEAVIRNNPSFFQPDGSGKDKLGDIKDTTRFPVEQVNWLEAETFCKAIATRLPTEAQWEYACRAGTITDYHFGKSLNGTEANCKGAEPFGTNETGPNLERTTKVASYPPNAFGLNDMHGNVLEWCSDWYAEKTDDLGTEDPERKFKQSEDHRVLRGGSWRFAAAGCRVADRNHIATGYLNVYGLRVVQVIASPGGDLVGKEAVAPPPESEKKLDPSKVDPDRKAAEYVLSIGGTIGVRINDHDHNINAAAKLPREAFQLTTFDLGHGNRQVTDGGLANFSGCKNLTYVSLAGMSQVSDAGVAHFRDCKNLKELDLHNSNVGEAGLAHFRDCKGLTQLWLHNSPNVSDAGVAYFKECKNLKALSLYNTQVTDAGLANFKEHKNLTELNLAIAIVSDAGLANFKDCKNLKALWLGGAQMTDTGLAYFMECKDLKELGLQKTKVTATGIDDLKNALPKCKIEWDGGIIEPKK